MSRRSRYPILALALMPTLAFVAPLAAAGGGVASTKLLGLDEVPSLNTPASGFFTATLNDDGTEVDYELTYNNMEGDVTQAHLHLAQEGVNGGITVFLCSNLGNGPVGTQACPTDNGTVSGTFTAANMGTGTNAQGLAPGEFFGLLRAIRKGYVYANVHTTVFPGGEIRGQLRFTPTE